MALTSLLVRAGERCAVLGESERPRSGRHGLERVTHRLSISQGPISALDSDFSSHAKVVIASDFLEPTEVWRKRLSKLSSRPATGVLLHIVDPAEREFPYKGRLELIEPGTIKSKIPFLVGRAEKAKAKYIEKFMAHEDALQRTASRLGWTLVTHQTDQPATLALTALFRALDKDA